MKKTVKTKVQKICTNEYEHEYWPKGQLVLGIDEAGRGPLAGPLTVAGVIFPVGYENPLIYDSKSLSEKKREELFDIIKEEGQQWETYRYDTCYEDGADRPCMGYRGADVFSL